MREQLKSLVKAPVLQQYFIEHAVHMLIQNGFDRNTAGASGDYIKGLNEATLYLLNSLLDGEVISNTAKLIED